MWPLSSSVMHSESPPLSSYNNSTRAAILVGPPFFFALAALSAWLALTDSKTLAAAAILFALASAFALVGAFGLRLLPFVRCFFAATPDGLHVFDRHMRETIIPWATVSHFKNRPILQVIDVYGRDGKRVLSVDHWAINFDSFQSALSRHARGSA